jgi:hypothetical protein
LWEKGELHAPGEKVKKEDYAPAPPQTTEGLFGMSHEQMMSFADVTKPPLAPDPPPLSDPNWAGKGAHGVGGAHSKTLIGTNADMKPVPKGGKSSHLWMYKVDSFAPEIIAGEVAAGRVQSLLGLGKTHNIWTQPNNGWDEFPDGTIGVMQHFKKQPSFRDMGVSKPWLTHPKKETIAAQLQIYNMVSWLVSDMDDHDGNFVLDTDGVVTACDHGQSGKFFDSSHTLASTLDWTVPAHPKTGHKPFQEDDKGFPKKMLTDWADGKNVPVASLMSAPFREVVAKAEAIPSDVYKKMWRPYAEALHKATGECAGFSAVESDKTVDGFLDAMDQRRKNLRKDVGGLYVSLAKRRAQSLKGQGDPRPISEIEAEIRTNYGIDEFLDGGMASVVAPPAGQQEMAQEAYANDSIGWDDAKLPQTSRVPSIAALTEAGENGIDMMFGGPDIKDNRGQFYKVGDNIFLSFMLEPTARKRIQARIGESASFGMVAPQKPASAPFTPPPKPPALEIAGAEDLYKQVVNAGGMTSDKVYLSGPFEGQSLPKIAKHLDKWAKGEAASGSAGYILQGYNKAKEMAESTNPLLKAAGEFYVDQFLKIGDVDTAGEYTLKDPADVPEADKTISLFEPTEEQMAALDQVQKDMAADYAAVVDEAKAAHEKAEAKKQEDYEKKLADYEKKKAEFEEAAKTKGQIPTNKLSYYPAPFPVKRPSTAAGGNKALDPKTKWDGSYVKSYDTNENPMTTYDIDLSDAVSAVAAVSSGTTNRLLVNYVPDAPKSGSYSPNAYEHFEEAKAQRYPGRNGQVRIQFPKGATNTSLRKMIQQVFSSLDIDARPATEMDQELAYLRQMAYLRRMEGYPTGVAAHEVEPDGTVQEKIAFWSNRFEGGPPSPKANTATSPTPGFDPRYEPERTVTGHLKKSGGKVVYKKNPDGTRKRNSAYQRQATDVGAGRFAFRRFDVSDADVKKLKEEFVLTHGASSYFSDMINAMVMYSSEKRTRLGIGQAATPSGAHQPGQSPGSDVRSGGSNDLFFRLKNATSSTSSVTLDASILQYTCARGTQKGSSDSYGAKVDYTGYNYDVIDRHVSVQERRLIEMMADTEHTSPEILIGDKVDLTKWVRSIRFQSAAKRAAAIKRLKDAGITTLGPENRPVEEVIIH